MKILFWITVLSFPTLGLAQSSGAVAKVGLIWNDYLPDNRSVLGLSQVGSSAGLEVRLGAEDKTYFKLGGYYARIHMQPQEHFGETQFFKVVDGYDLLKAICGLEFRLISGRKVHWRISGAPAFNYVVGVRGDVKFADLDNGYFGLHLASGIDIGLLSIDLAFEPGIEDFSPTIKGSKPLMMMFSAGINF